jgi:putative ABC transport system substrate-binding protein
MRAQAAELVRLKPDVLLAGATLALVALQEATRDIPIVFAQVTDPVGAGFVASLARLAGTPDGGIIVLPGPGPAGRRDRIIALAEQHRLPAVYPFRYWVVSGGLASYGIDNVELYRLAASYVDRILKGEKPADLPVQHATKFQLVINLKTAKTLGLEIPPMLLARADEVIE